MRSTIVILLLAFTWFINPQTVYAESLKQDGTGTIYTVQPGDYLSQIARDQLGDAKAWPQIVAATNKQASTDSRFIQIHNPQNLYAGQLLWISHKDVYPTATPTSPSTATPRSTVSARTELYPASRDGDLYGYVDTNGNFLIEPEYVVAGDFHQGVAAVSKDGRLYGFVDPSNDFVIPARFANVGRFSDGIAPAVPTDMQYYAHNFDVMLSGYIDQQGEWIIAPQFLRVEPFRNGVARALDTKDNYVYLDRAGNVLRSFRARIKGPSTTYDDAGRTPEFLIIHNALDTQDGLCQNRSTYIQHPVVWRCEVGATTYDPCLVSEDNVSIVCNDPFDVYGGSFVAQTLEEPISTAKSRDEWIAKMWLEGVGPDNVSCVRLLGNTYSSGASSSDEPAPNTYRCSDGSYLIGEPWAVPARSLHFIMMRLDSMQVDNASGNAQQTKIVSVKRLLSLTTEVSDVGGGPGDFIPTGVFYWQY